MNKLKILKYDRKYRSDGFDCGQKALNNYIQKNVTKDVKNGSCTCFVMLNEKEEVTAYYTLSTESINIESAPPEFQKKIKYQYVPLILLGRLAVDKTQKAQGFGKLMLVDALKKSLNVANHHVGAVAVIVDPITDAAKNFYLKYGFTSIPDSGRMFMSMKKIESAFSQ